MADVVTVDSSSEEEDSTNNLTSAECEKRCQAFAEITGTDTALAMFFLQDREWILETSLNDYFQSQGQGDSSHSVSSASSIEPSSCRDVAKSSAAGSATFLTTAPPVIQPQKENQIRILSWNIDGLDPDNLQSRTEGACSVLKQENPDVIFLQEVVKRSLSIIESRLGGLYQIHRGYEDPALLSFGAYFTVLLVQKNVITTENVHLAGFPTTTMERNLLEVQCVINSIPVTLMTSHLESTAEYREERQRQLKKAFDEMKREQGRDRTVIFGGDLNLRDKELTGISAKPPGFYDIWECTGKRPEAKFTWDLTRNDNKQLHGKFQPRCRFDRMFICHPKDKVKLKPVYFELIGIQRLASCRRFPSDHWGILAHLNMVDNINDSSNKLLS